MAANDDDQRFMAAAIEQAIQGRDAGGVPVGAVLVADGKILGAGHNRRVQHGSAIRHGETDALENAGRLPADVYRKATMYTTLSPCHMCSGAILLYGIPRVVIGEHSTFLGEEAHLENQGVEVVVLNNPECIELMQEFITHHPEVWHEDIGVQG
jgi:cytosine/creatinine deaminase